jgi:hypothetical protein
MAERTREYHKKHSAAAVIAAIAGSGGIKKTLCERLRVHRHTIDRYLHIYPTAAAAYQEECDNVGDFVESVILKAIQSGDVETARWYAARKLKDRGYSERIEFKDMSNEELLAFIEARVGTDRSGVDGGGEAGPRPPTLH